MISRSAEEKVRCKKDWRVSRFSDRQMHRWKIMSLYGNFVTSREKVSEVVNVVMGLCTSD